MRRWLRVGPMNIKRGQKGFTLIELLVTVGILGTVIGVMSMTVTQLMIITPKTNDWAIALRQVQNAGYWISRDVLMSQSVTLAQNLGDPLVALEWDDGGGTHYTVDYVFISGDEGGELKRELNGASPGTLIAQYIVEADTSFVVDAVVDTKYNLTVRALCGGAEVTRVYQVTPRPD